MTPKPIEEQAGRWTEGPLAEALARFPERAPSFATISGLPVERLYLPDQEPIDRYAEKLGFPGEFPFTRGVHPTMYRGRLWTMREYAGYSTAEESNRRYRYLLEQGSTGLSIAFDLPTQIGLDSDHPLCLGEVGRVGVAVNTLADLEALFEGIPLDRVSTSMTINSPAAVLLAMYIVLAEKQGVDPKRLEGTVQNDILKEYIVRGTYIFPPDRACDWSRTSWSMASTTSRTGTRSRSVDITSARPARQPCKRSHSRWPTRSATSRRRCAGLHVDEFAPRLAFFFAAHTDFFEEIAKFRAAAALRPDHEGAVRCEVAAEPDAAVPHADRRRDPHGTTTR